MVWNKLEQFTDLKSLSCQPPAAAKGGHVQGPENKRNVPQTFKEVRWARFFGIVRSQRG